LVSDAVASVGIGILVVILVRSMTVPVAGSAGGCVPRELRQEGALRVAALLMKVYNLLPFSQVGAIWWRAHADVLDASRSPWQSSSMSCMRNQFVFVICGRDFVGWAYDSPSDGRAGVCRRGHRPRRILLQRHGGRRLICRRSMVVRNQAGFLQTKVDAVYDWLTAIYSNRSNLLVSTGVHFIGWIIGAAEVYAGFAFMGRPVGWAEAHHHKLTPALGHGGGARWGSRR
jgi:hypothetical protein